LDINGSRIFVTRCGGFIGLRLGEIAIERGAAVGGFDMSEAAVERATKAGVEASVAAVNDPVERIAELMRGADAVVNTAAIVEEAGDWEQFRRVNVDGAVNVAHAAIAAGVPRLVQLSSVMVYGLDFPADCREDARLSGDDNPYCTTKIEGEAALRSLERGDIGVVIVRPGDVYGPRSAPWVLRPLDLMRKGLFGLPARGEGRFNHTYVDNLVDGILLTLEREAAGQVFNISDGESCTNAEYFGRLADAAGMARPRKVPAWAMKAAVAARSAYLRGRGRKPDADVQAIRYLLRPGTYSIDRARRVLGYEPVVSLDEGMRRVAESLRSGDSDAT